MTKNISATDLNTRTEFYEEGEGVSAQDVEMVKLAVDAMISGIKVRFYKMALRIANDQNRWEKHKKKSFCRTYLLGDHKKVRVTISFDKGVWSTDKGGSDTSLEKLLKISMFIDIKAP